jgi:ribose transport system permease protein
VPSIESSALEPTKAELQGLTPAQKIGRFLPVYGLVILTVVLIVVFSVMLPRSFPTMLNLKSILGDKSIIAILSLAAMIPMVTGKIDLTVGYGIVLWHILAISLQVMGLPWPVACLLILCAGAFTGFLNGLLVEVARIDSFIATLGTGTVIYALARWHSGGRQVVGELDPAFYALNSTFIGQIPITAFYVLILALVMWVVLEYLPIGRYLYAIGANPKAASLNGIPVARFTMGAFIASGLLSAFAGECGAGVPVACIGRRISGVHHDQTGPGQCVGHIDRRHHSGGRDFRHPAIRRRKLGRADVQRGHFVGGHWHRRIRPTQTRRCRHTT